MEEATQGDDVQAALRRLLNDYATAFHRFDAPRVLAYYDTPLLFLAGPDVRLMLTRADTEAWLRSFWARLAERGFARASAFSPLHVKPVSPTVAFASVRFVRYTADGQELERNGATYVLRKTGDGWRIAVVVGHDPGGVLRLD